MIGTVGVWLESAGYAVLKAQDGREGLDAFLSRRPDLVLLEVLLSELDGLELCRHIRTLGRTPVVFLSSLDTPEERARGLEWGADDYLAKPVDERELLKRLAAILRRTGVTTVPNRVLETGSLRIDVGRQEVSVAGTPTKLTLLEFRLLEALVESADTVASSDDLLNRIWGSDYHDRGLVKWHVTRLRRKLVQAGLPQESIVNIRGVGYRYQS